MRGEPPLRASRVLLVEDNPVQAKVLAAWLTGRLACDVKWVDDGTVANRLVAEGGFDLVITDIGLPGVDGLTLLRTSKHHFPDTPALLLTAHDSIEYAVQALRDKADDFLHKPIRAQQFVNIVESLLTRPSDRQAASRTAVKHDRIDDRYLLRGRIGKGGSATVWLADDEKLGREVAIKLLHVVSEELHDEVEDAFLREATLTASLQHPNVVQMLDFGCSDGRAPYVVMELLKGSSLGDRFNAQELVPPDELIRIACAALDGLEAVHDAGIIHRDVKPENIFLSKQDARLVPKLIDFGISKAVRDLPSRATQDGVLRGTPHYMSPEHARGIADLDARTDIYAVGAVLYEGLVGQAPFDSPNTGDLLVMIIGGGATPVRKFLSEFGAVSDVIEKAMARERDDRYADAAEMRAALIVAAKQTPALARR